MPETKKSTLPPLIQDGLIFILFGITGDLAWRKLVPALFSLFQQDRLPENFKLLGLARSEQDDRKLRDLLHTHLSSLSDTPVPDEAWQAFSQQIHYIRSNFKDPDSLKELSDTVAKAAQDWGKPPTCIYYMATPPETFGTIATLLGECGLSQDIERSRLVLEKPIGHNLESAIALNKTIRTHFKEAQIFRLDHYLGKETVQNILAFRFANPLFEPLWNRHYVHHVAITVAEDIGIGNRADYYENAGALRDMIQNHLLQLLCLVAMEAPISLDAEEVRNKKVDVLHSIRAIPPEKVHSQAVRGQYADGWINGENVPAYRNEPDVADDSTTETYAALKLYVDNWRWQNVPFYLRSGKRMAQKVSEISIRFRPVPHQTFPSNLIAGQEPAQLVICIQPTEGMILKFYAKKPGPEMQLTPVDMHFGYREAFKNNPSPEAYETLIWDVMENDQTLFMRADQVEAAWRVVMPILDHWDANPPTDFPNYTAGTWGPESSQMLVAKDKCQWLSPSYIPDDTTETETSDGAASLDGAAISATSMDGFKEMEKAVLS